MANIRTIIAGIIIIILGIVLLSDSIEAINVFNLKIAFIISSLVCFGIGGVAIWKEITSD